MADAQAEAIARAAEHWSTMPTTGRTRWWSSPEIHRHINGLVCGKPIDGSWAGLQRRMWKMAPEGGFGRAVSVGVGHGGKELELLTLGLVQHFDLFEISDARVEAGTARATALNVADRVTFHVADAFTAGLGSVYDLVYWNNALHHMLDVDEAVRWSHDRLRVGGAFVMDDFVGPSRFQWTDDQLALATQVREALPDRFLRHPTEPGTTLRRAARRPSVDGMIASDPTEAADSDNIVAAVRRHFPGSKVIPTGGVIYTNGLNDVLANFDESDENDLALLRTLLVLDGALAKAGQTYYAVALATKRPPPSLPRKVARRLGISRRLLRRGR